VATAVVPYGDPLRFELTASGDGILPIPQRADAVTQMAFEGQALTEKATGMTAVTGTLAFNATRWSQALTPLPESSDLRFERGGDLVRVSSGGSPSAPARLAMASPTTPARVMAVPLVAPDESALIDLAARRPWGARPALVPREVPPRLLLAYLSVGEYDIAGAMARALARAFGEAKTVRWAEPSFSQLIFGYAYALNGERRALAAWCRRTDAARFLGTDGVILAAESAWQRRDRNEATRLLSDAASMAPPVMSFGLEIGVSLAFRLGAAGGGGRIDFGRLGQRGEQLARLATGYSQISTRSDPRSATVTTPQSARTPVSLTGRKWRRRAAWKLTYLLTRLGYHYSLNSSTSVTSRRVDLGRRSQDRRPSKYSRGATVNEPSNAKSPPLEAREISLSEIPSRREVQPETRSQWEVLVRYLVVLFSFAWLAVLGAAIIFAAVGKPQLEIPLFIVQPGVFVVLGVATTMAVVGRRTQELSRQVQASEELARAREEEAMKGRALAAALQAESAGDGPPSHHARMSRALFGDLIGESHDSAAATT
jgi:hypothetical protein